MNRDELFELIRGLPGYGGFKLKDFDYVPAEAGLTSRASVDRDETIEVR